MEKDKDKNIDRLARDLLKATMSSMDRIEIDPKRSYHVIMVVAGVSNDPIPGTESLEVELTTTATRHGVEQDHDRVKEIGKHILQQAIDSLQPSEVGDFESAMNSLILAERAGISDQCRSIGGIKNPGKKEGRDQN